ncbi:MAG: complex I subunit 5 family protein, partial [Lachnospiraceae bacterium]
MLLIVTLLFPVIAGIASSVCRVDGKTRNSCYAAVLAGSDLLVLLTCVKGGEITLFHLFEHVTFAFRVDELTRYFLIAVVLLYTAATVYAFEYMTIEHRQPVFFGAIFTSMGAIIAVALSANLVTMYCCFEALSLTSFVLIIHEMDKAAVAAGLKYLFYSIAGALMGMFAMFVLYAFASGDTTFAMGGFLDLNLAAGHEDRLLLAAITGIIGFGAKAGMFPMNGWLPTAHPICPAPASSLMSGIIAKAGIFCVIRLVYFSIGAQFLRGTWVQTAWICLAMTTIFLGSMMAFQEKVTKKRLAYSSVSQISYIMLGLSMLTDDGLRGGLVHLLSHCASKGCLFLCAGVFIYKLGKKRVDQLKGIGRQMPVTMWCFMIAAMSLVGIPPMGGFV